MIVGSKLSVGSRLLIVHNVVSSRYFQSQSTGHETQNAEEQHISLVRHLKLMDACESESQRNGLSLLCDAVWYTADINIQC